MDEWMNEWRMNEGMNEWNNELTLKVLGVVLWIKESSDLQINPDEMVIQNGVDVTLQRDLAASDEFTI